MVQILLISQRCGSSWVTMREKNMGTIETPPQWKGDDHIEELLRETTDSKAYGRSSEAARDDKIQLDRNKRSKESQGKDEETYRLLAEKLSWELKAKHTDDTVLKNAATVSISRIEKEW